ncbi:bifunctional UDP-sugar hydrolase/5'-nucleotidase UshA [Shewanella donghaensis]|uniref:bifunctional UDP-sugar hydrolase/5'-nucleotidase UshA n=1 Tax=Shewanella donghaensis TaxID=238836 RepID=UPI001D05A07B|nr:bifunctional UDP-sugar hydrolase/5'-nucleotidase UshA [Shewanella donghaensis]
MIRIIPSLLAVITMLVFLSGCEPRPDCNDDNCTKFTVLHTNDNHGRFWHNKAGEYGMAARFTVIDGIRKEVAADGGHTLVLSGGDINTGVPESDLQNAIPDFIGMNMIGYDAMAVGNHEFDNPLSVLAEQAELATFPMLAANIYDKDTNERYFEPYKVFKVGGIDIAVVGLTTNDTPKLTNPQNTESLLFTDPIAEMKKLLKQIKADESVDLVFAATHMGHYQDGEFGSNAPGDVSMARALNEGELNAIIGGHSQNPVCMSGRNSEYDKRFKAGGSCRPDKQNGTWIMQAHEWGRFVGRADFEYINGKLYLIDYELIPINLKRTAFGKKLADPVADFYVRNPDVEAALLPFQQKGSAELDVLIGKVDGLLEGDRKVVRSQQTNLGRLIAKVHSSKVFADFGIMNSGGVRASITAGDVAYRDVLTVQPFSNTIGLAEMSGEKLIKYLSNVASKTRTSGAYAQFYGIDMTVKCRDRSVEIHSINNQPFDINGQYRFSIPSFSAAGGDNYPKINILEAGYVDAIELYEYIKQQKTINVADYEPNGEVKFTQSKSDLGCSIY